MEPITYSLRDGQKFSDAYYKNIATFTAEVLARLEAHLLSTIQSFQSYLEMNGIENSRTVHEYAFELLVLGVLWTVYAPAALRLPAMPQRTLARLAGLREQRPGLKAVVDLLRGLLAWAFLASPDGAQPPPEATSTGPSLDDLNRLLKWLAATGDFNQEILRLNTWQGFFSQLEADEAAAVLETCHSLAAWFESRSEEALGRYTPNVENFLAETHPDYRWREDAIFCGRRRVEYHLGMVGIEVLNRAFRQAFLATRRRILLVPPCMCRPKEKCKAQQTSFGARCAHCTPGCRVNQLTCLGEKNGFGVFVLPDELSVFSTRGPKPQAVDGLGLVGVSCVLTNLGGGWETRQMGVPAQGIPLDYCGCKWHWHREGISTDINLHQLLRVMEIEPVGTDRKSETKDEQPAVGETTSTLLK